MEILALLEQYSI